jgi:hypothetical protein
MYHYHTQNSGIVPHGAQQSDCVSRALAKNTHGEIPDAKVPQLESPVYGTFCYSEIVTVKEDETSHDELIIFPIPSDGNYSVRSQQTIIQM